jgi:hypothetical protein
VFEDLNNVNMEEYEPDSEELVDESFAAQQQQQQQQ